MTNHSGGSKYVSLEEVSEYLLRLLAPGKVREITDYLDSVVEVPSELAVDPVSFFASLQSTVIQPFEEMLQRLEEGLKGFEAVEKPDVSARTLAGLDFGLLPELIRTALGEGEEAEAKIRNLSVLVEWGDWAAEREFLVKYLRSLIEKLEQAINLFKSEIIAREVKGVIRGMVDELVALLAVEGTIDPSQTCLDLLDSRLRQEMERIFDI